MPELKRNEIRKILKGERGAIAQIARDLNVASQTVTLTLKGKSESARIMAACSKRASEILLAAQPAA